MASLNDLEGEAVEGVGLVLLVLLVVIAFYVWKAVHGIKFPNFPNFAKWISDLFKSLFDALKNSTGQGDFNYSLPSPGELDGGGPDWVVTGTNVGAGDPAAYGGS